jgi:anti-sigma factor RsiW
VDGFHVQDKVLDYVLDLLPAEEQRTVALHITRCDSCRSAVQREREIGRFVQQTLNKATVPDYGRLQQLMPHVPSRRSSVLTFFNPYQQWAVACLLLVAMMGAFLFGGEGVFGRLSQPVADQQVTISFIQVAGTAEILTTGEAGTHLVPAARPTVPVEQSRSFTDVALERVDVPVAPLPEAPQVTPAPAATYFQ